MQRRQSPDLKSETLSVPNGLRQRAPRVGLASMEMNLVCDSRYNQLSPEYCVSARKRLFVLLRDFEFFIELSISMNLSMPPGEFQFVKEDILLPEYVNVMYCQERPVR
jgi:hypothetical protein